ncbi:MAG: 1,4-dihydroxy-6-naphthoate synthase [bacterium]
MSARLQLGISTCPNDTFAFHGLLTGKVRARGIELEIRLADVQELNESLARGEYDAAKASFLAALQLGHEVYLLRSGAALGFSAGPLLLAREARADLKAARVLGPGAQTTAALLYALYHGDDPEPEHVIFSEIMPALEERRADVGLCIHEGRFTHAERGLVCLEDLGQTWEADTGAPLPLGGIFGRKRLGSEVLLALEDAILESIDYAHAHPEEALVTMRRHATELSDEVLMGHVELYVNDDTRRLGLRAQAACRTLEQRARAAGLVAPGSRSLEIFGLEGSAAGNGN